MLERVGEGDGVTMLERVGEGGGCDNVREGG